jgi:hypothetical protein
LDITVLGGGHVGGPLLEDGFFYNINSRRPENIIEPGTVGDTSLMESVFGKALYTVFGVMGPGFIGFLIPRPFCNFEGKKGIVKTLERRFQTATGMNVLLTAKLEFLLYKGFFHKHYRLGIGGSSGFRKYG